MKELLLILSSVMEFDEMLDRLKKSIDDYKANPTEEGKKMIQIDCSLILSKEAVDQSGSGAEGVASVMKKMSDHERMDKIFNPDKN